ncbi:site-specific DNA-methyltransferase [Alistipes sp.]|uniref:site-specific DNA-methyltransferase n=1 Tax=Alistipes sp. TaxID=1872444 RepID=UPI0025C005BF|nr:site-specific DNA-methyltransferase [Alistipes sp.]MCI7139877.1 site-specific DNA-methyltransferase [Alistipes sp.]MDY5396943.1 site-specific DNA-methyltransferase [Alistipes sp.]
MRWLLDQGYKGRVDLVYIDPPFATGSIYSIDQTGRTATISKANNGNIAYKDTLQGEDFINFLKARVQLIHTLLSDRGSLYLHIDYKIGHYVKVMMDEIFGIENFRNDITRIKCNPKNFNRIGYGNIKDMILFYSKGPNPIWNNPVFKYTDEDLKKLYPKIDKTGRRYTTVPIHAPGETKDGATNQPFRGMYPPAGRHWRCSVEELEWLDALGLIEWSPTGNPRKINYADERPGKKAQDIWNFVDPAYPIYPTEKNEEMLKFIVQASSNPDSIVMDCFCGSGTTLKAANDCGRQWIGIDKADVAIGITKQRFSEVDYRYLEL